MEPTTETSTEEQPKPICPNCGGKMTRKGHFCPNCGQHRFDGRIRLRHLLAKFLHGLTHLDGKFIRMAWQLLVPGRVTVEYFRGRIKRYPHPVQFFFVVMFFFLFVFNKVFVADKLHVNSTTGSSFQVSRDTLKETPKTKKREDTDFFQALQRYVMIREFRQSYDSLPERLRTTATQAAFDSSEQILGRDLNMISDAIRVEMDSGNHASRHPLDSIPLSFVNRKFTIATSDLVHYQPDEVVELYHITNWQDRILVKQGIKSVRDPRGLLHAYLGSLTWTILVLMALMSGVLALLYWRQRRYYVEHFIFLLHQHSGTFLLLTLGLALDHFVHLGASWLLLFGWLGIALLIAMKRFYGQGWAKTTVKWMIYSFIYLFSFILLFFFGLLLVFVIF